MLTSVFLDHRLVDSNHWLMQIVATDFYLAMSFAMGQGVQIYPSQLHRAHPLLLLQTGASIGSSSGNPMWVAADSSGQHGSLGHGNFDPTQVNHKHHSMSWIPPAVWAVIMEVLHVMNEFGYLVVGGVVMGWLAGVITR